MISTSQWTAKRPKNDCRPLTLNEGVGFWAAFVLLTAMLMMPGGEAVACVGHTITIAVPDTIEEKLLAELIVMLVNERTGTEMKVRVFKKPQEIFDAVKKGEVGILIENTEHALKVIGKQKKKDSSKTYSVTKSEYQKRFGLIWLEPFGLLGGGN